MLTSPTSALEFFRQSEKFTLQIDTTLSMGVSMRVEERDNDIIFLGNDPNDRTLGQDNPAYSNADDGNLNYDQFDVYSTNAKVTFDVEADYDVGSKYLLDLGLFVRANAFYDVIGNCAHCTQRTDLAADARHTGSVINGGVVGTQWIFLDAYLDSRFDVADRYIDFRFGNQVLSWGESLFFQGGVNNINGIDVAKIRVPGAELREALIPAPMIRVQADIIQNLSIEAYYQFWWNRTQIDPTGSYFSTTDLMGRAGEFFAFGNDPGSGCPPPPPGLPPFPPPPLGCNTYLTGMPRGNDFLPSSQKQGGLALRYYSNMISTEFGFYYVHYHNKTPALGATATKFTPTIAVPTEYHRDYANDIDVIGFSASTEVFGAQIAGEISYRWNEAVPLSTAIQSSIIQLLSDPTLLPGSTASASGWERAKKVQVQANFIGNINQSSRLGAGYIVQALGANNINLLGEFAVAIYPGFDSTDAATWAAAPGRTVDKTSWGYQLGARLEYAIPFGIPVNLTPSIFFLHDAGGDNPGGTQFISDRKAVTLGVDINYLNRWGFNLTYANFLGAGDANLGNDRDFFGGSLSYAF